MAFNGFGDELAYSQMAPGRDVERLRTPGQPGRPRLAQGAINSAITGSAQPRPGVPEGTFRGAQQTVGARPTPQSAMERLNTSGIAPGETNPQQPAAAPQVQRPSYSTRLEGFDGTVDGGGRKLDSLDHAMKSPKYAFGQLAQSGEFGYDNIGGMLGKLQQTHGDLFKGWEVIPGKEKIRFTGDPSQLHGSWEGVDEVDLVRNFTQGGDFDPSQAAFWWGASSPQSRQQVQAGPPPAALQQAITGTAPTLGLQGGSFSEQLRQQLMQQLGSAPSIAALAKSQGLIP